MVAESPYATAVALGGAPPTFVNTKQLDDQQRVQAYWAYTDIYNNAPSAFQALLRDDGDEISRRYIPGARTIIESTNSYLARDLAWTWIMSDTGEPAEDAQRLVTQSFVDALFRREEFLSKFGSVKRWTLARGDGMIHVTADPLKAEGTRIRITELDPAQYFPIVDPVDEERVIGCYIVNIVLADDGTTQIAQRLMYRRVMDEEDAAAFGSPIGTVAVQMGFYALAKWDDRYPLTEEDLEGAEVPTRLDTPGNQLLMAGMPLPSQITAIPVYHFRNRRGGAPGVFGVSEIQGVETVLGGMTTTMSDQDLALALQSLGVYWTDSAPPVDANGVTQDWVISPAGMVELQDGKKFGRVEGVTTVEPGLGHYGALRSAALETTGTPEVAVGTIEVTAAESGIALAIRFAPLTSKNSEKQTELGGKLDQFMHDLIHGWIPAYEGLTPDERLEAVSSFGPMLPLNRKEVVAEVTALVQAGLVSREWALSYLAKTLGLNFPDDMLQQILDEQAAALDVVGGRLDTEAAPPEA